MKTYLKYRAPVLSILFIIFYCSVIPSNITNSINSVVGAIVIGWNCQTVIEWLLRKVDGIGK